MVAPGTERASMSHAILEVIMRLGSLIWTLIKIRLRGNPFVYICIDAEEIGGQFTELLGDVAYSRLQGVMLLNETFDWQIGKGKL